MIERQKFVRLVLKGQVTMTQACQQFGISRKTGYKILARHAELGMAGLADASRAPKSHPNQTSPEVEGARHSSVDALLVAQQAQSIRH